MSSLPGARATAIGMPAAKNALDPTSTQNDSAAGSGRVERPTPGVVVVAMAEVSPIRGRLARETSPARLRTWA